MMEECALAIATPTAPPVIEWADASAILDLWENYPLGQFPAVWDWLEDEFVSGSLESGTIMKYVKRSEDVQEGDRLITSGFDGVFPKGLLVGTATKVRKQNLGLFQYVEVTPAVISSRTEEVLVVSVEAESKTDIRLETDQVIR